MARFRGNDRFEVVRRIGQGAMGTVFEAYDRAQQARVAIKVLRPYGRDALLRFKNEFRALRDVYHRNLVTLGELFENDGEWFYTMQYVEGVDFLAYVDARDELATARLRDGTGVPVTLRFDEQRLRLAVRQLALGLAALHAAGKVHRDIKPANILVTPEGRLMLLDFGLVTDVVRSDSITQADERIGTPAYMAPEHARGELSDARADCYSVGVLLYQAITGRLPATGTPQHVLAIRGEQEAVRPSRATRGVPEDLDDLCFALLARAADQRPTASEISARLAATVQGERRPRSEPVPLDRSSRTGIFVGRASELERMHELFGSVAPHSPVMVLITGESGIGKSELLNQLTSSLADAGALVLRGHCYEREAVPYKGIDGVIDALSTYLAQLPHCVSVELLPERAGLLAAAFPVLERVDAIADAPQISIRALDPQLRRSMVFETLRELLRRTALRRRVIIAIDDFQWTDADSLALLHDVLRPPDAPGLFVVATLRDATGTDGVMRALSSLSAPVHEVRLAGLDEDDAKLLVEHLAGSRPIDPTAIARAAHGHPLFIDALVRYHAASDASSSIRELSLHDALRTRIQQRPTRELEILEVLAVAAFPVDLALLAAVLDRRGDVAHVDRDLASLRSANLVRTADGTTSDGLEIYHHQIGKAVRDRLDDLTRRGWHRRIAAELDGSGRGDPDQLAMHWLAAGVTDRATERALQAAERAVEATAFDRAIELYRLVASLGHVPHDQLPALQIRLADAISFTGRGEEAARLYGEVARDARPADAIELYRRAAELLLMQGHIKAGRAALERAVEVAGLSIPRSLPAKVVRLAFARLAVRARGQRVRLREASDIAPNVLRRIDVCFTATIGLGLIDPLLGALFQSRHHRLAYRAGEVSRIALAKSGDATYAGIFELAPPDRVQTWLAHAREMAVASGDPRITAITELGAALVEASRGRWTNALVHLTQADTLARERCKRTTWEIGQIRVYTVIARVMIGQVQALRAFVETGLREAAERNDVSTITHLRAGLAVMAPLFEGDVEAARANLRSVGASSDETITGFMVDLARTQLALYTGADNAHASLAGTEGAMRRSFFMRAPIMRILYWDLRARAGLAALQAGDEAVRGEVARASGWLRRERLPWGRALARIIDAGMARQAGDREAAIAGYRAAATACEQCEFALHASFSARAAMQLTGDTRGVTEIDDRLASSGVRYIDNMARVYTP